MCPIVAPTERSIKHYLPFGNTILYFTEYNWRVVAVNNIIVGKEKKIDIWY